MRIAVVLLVLVLGTACGSAPSLGEAPIVEDASAAADAPNDTTTADTTHDGANTPDAAESSPPDVAEDVPTSPPDTTVSTDTTPSCTPITKCTNPMGCGINANLCGGTINCGACPRGACVSGSSDPAVPFHYCECRRVAAWDDDCANNKLPPVGWQCGTQTTAAMMPGCSGKGAPIWCCPS